jgi:predicted metal-binding protein
VDDLIKDVGTGQRPTIIICTNCKIATETTESPEAPFAGARLADAAQSLPDTEDVEIVRIKCLANCSRGPSVAMRHANTWTYIFGNIDPEADAQSLVEGARLLATSPDGLMPWKGRPTCLKKGLIARIPPLDFAGEPA